MKRTPLKRKAGLRNRTPLKRGKPLRRRSQRMADLYGRKGGRREFVSQFLGQNPLCEVKWDRCTVSAVDVHEVLARGLGGAIVPGEKADRQGQRFVAICRMCHNDLDLQPQRAKNEGWIRGIGQ